MDRPHPKYPEYNEQNSHIIKRKDVFLLISPVVFAIGMISLFGILLFVILRNIFWANKPGEEDR